MSAEYHRSLVRRWLCALGILLFRLSDLNGQTNQQIKFAKTDWILNNRDSAFYRSDTLKLISVPKTNHHSKSAASYTESHELYSKTSDYIELGFSKNRELLFSERKDNSGGFVYGSGTWRWSFDPEKQSLTFYYLDKLFSSFRVCCREETKIVSIFGKQSEAFSTMVLILVRLR